MSQVAAAVAHRSALVLARPLRVNLSLRLPVPAPHSHSRSPIARQSARSFSLWPSSAPSQSNPAPPAPPADSAPSSSIPDITPVDPIPHSEAASSTWQYIADSTAYVTGWSSWGAKPAPPAPSPDTVLADAAPSTSTSSDTLDPTPTPSPPTDLSPPVDISISPPADFSTLSSAVDQLTALATTASSTITSAATDLVSTTATIPPTATLHIGTVRELGLGSFATPVGWLENLLEASHVLTGLPWWGTIVLTTVAIRALLLPLVGRMQRNAALMASIQPTLKPIQSRLTAAARAGDRQEQMKATEELQALYKLHNVNPFSMLGTAVVQMPIWISFYLALTAMAALPVPGFADGGILWFHDLTAPDPLKYALPAVSAVGFLAVFELGAEMNKATMQPGMKMFMRVMAVSMIWLTTTFPAAIFVYWTTSNIFTLFQISIFRHPAVRRHYNIPDVAASQPPLAVRDAGSLVVAVDKAGVQDAWKMVKEVEAEVAAEEKVKVDVKKVEGKQGEMAAKGAGGAALTTAPTVTVDAAQILPTVTMETKPTKPAPEKKSTSKTAAKETKAKAGSTTVKGGSKKQRQKK
ncbi:hypothetical protein M427DRAFT_51585 [Gonapodya prolifera JEL478]|uniref:Membrane insertase YidC/Oxa/ALB C-terminal domain-containing protein n=1 Tax=Gonapodya prolifera (strain JEL478) TaxID=1344416 RepID=A0A139AXC3_GONPJ|nr:hypothetical protein M427DRAFT_51585 [Gonapodya prolifera JEL478]|eukprot:KXS21357.1 hypothetical protein M427DRAFT_51585 [Gonapodya prolifera JEL478]